MDNIYEEQLRRQRQQQQQQYLQEEWAKYVHRYKFNLDYPSNVESLDESKPLRTDKDLINRYLLNCGIPYGQSSEVDNIADKLQGCIVDLEKTGCFERVQVQIGKLSNKKQEDEVVEGAGEELQFPDANARLNVLLKEKKWYRLYVGGGYNYDQATQPEINESSGTNLLSQAQFETSCSFINPKGQLDSTSILHTVDATSTSSYKLLYERPLVTILPENIAYILMDSFNLNLFKYSLGLRAILDTIDYEWTRSYKERQRFVSLRVCNQGMQSTPTGLSPEPFSGLDWTILFRDIIPPRHEVVPYAYDASPQIVAQSGPSIKSSISYEYRTNGVLCDNKFNPTEGIDFHSKLELAGPPGTVGFIKAQAGGSVHIPIRYDKALCFHGSLDGGILQSILYGGACNPPTISDKFFVGGPMQLRGFLPAGIGPRASSKNSGSLTPGGDAMGGNLFYTATIAASMSPPKGIFSAITESTGIRLFAFGNVGTLVSSMTNLSNNVMSRILKSSRASVGVGICAGSPIGRLELTYAIPLKSGPRDAKRNFQFGLGFSFG